MADDYGNLTPEEAEALREYYRSQAPGGSGSTTPSAPAGGNQMSYSSDQDLADQLRGAGYNGPWDHNSMVDAFNRAQGGSGKSGSGGSVVGGTDLLNIINQSGLSQAQQQYLRDRLAQVELPDTQSQIEMRRRRQELDEGKFGFDKETWGKEFDRDVLKAGVDNAMDRWKATRDQANERARMTGAYFAPPDEPDLPNRFRMDQYVRDFQYRYPGQHPDNAIVDQLFPTKLPPGVTMTPGQVKPPKAATPTTTPGTQAPAQQAQQPDPYAKWQPPDDFQGDKIPGWEPPKEWNWPPDWRNRVARWRKGEPLSPPAQQAAPTPAPAAATSGKVSASLPANLPENAPNGGNSMPQAIWQQGMSQGAQAQGNQSGYGAQAVRGQPVDPPDYGGPNPYGLDLQLVRDPRTGQLGDRTTDLRRQDLTEWEALREWERRQAELLGRFNGQDTLEGRQQALREEEARNLQRFRESEMFASPENAAAAAVYRNQAPWQQGMSQGNQQQGGIQAQGQGGIGGQQAAAGAGGQNPYQRWGIPEARQMNVQTFDRMNPSQRKVFGSYVRATGQSLDDYDQEVAKYRPNRASTMQTARFR